MACMTENSETTPWSMQTEVVSTNLCHFLDNHKMEVITLQQITGKGSVQAVYKWIWGNGFPSIDAFYLICDKFSNEGIHIEDFLRKDGIPLQVEEAAANGPRLKQKGKKRRKRRKEEKGECAN
ncbi:MAG: hypothetical protein ACLTER_21235 [Ruminococcus sp.]